MHVKCYKGLSCCVPHTVHCVRGTKEQLGKYVGTLRSIVTATSVGYYVTPQQISPTCGVTQSVYKGMHTKYDSACIFGIITRHANRIHVASCCVLITESTSSTYNATNALCLHVKHV
jgi:hypothetical protein